MGDDADILIVGAGPTGLALAVELCRRDVRCRIIEKSPTPNADSRALGMFPRTLEQLSFLGVSDRLREEALEIAAIRGYAGDRQLFRIVATVDSPFPHPFSIPQAATEEILRGRLAVVGGKVEWGTELVRLDSQADAIVGTWKVGEREEQWRGRFIVGCDGAHSTVRRALGVEFSGTRYLETFVLADVAVHAALPEREAVIFFSPDGPLAFFPFREPSRYRMVAQLGRAEVDTDGHGLTNQTVTLEELREFVRARSSLSVEISDPRWISAFRIHRRMVSEYRRGRVLLAGDAAHIHSPVGGQGMNTGIQDAINLGWKLAAVCRGRAQMGLLDTFGLERRPVAASILRGTDFATRAVLIKNPVGRGLRNSALSTFAKVAPLRRRTLDGVAELRVRYRRSPIVQESIRPKRRRGLRPVLAGDRAPDFKLPGDTGATRLYAKLGRTEHIVLFFTDGSRDGLQGAHHCATGLGTMDGWITESLILPPPYGQQVYGLSGPTVLAIRPDGYVGLRADVADYTRALTLLEVYFKTLAG